MAEEDEKEVSKAWLALFSTTVAQLKKVPAHPGFWAMKSHLHYLAVVPDDTLKEQIADPAQWKRKCCH